MRGITTDRQVCPECQRTWGHAVVGIMVEDDGVIPVGAVDCLLSCRSCDHVFDGTARVWELQS